MSDCSNTFRKSKYNPELRKERIRLGLCGRCGKDKGQAETANCNRCIDTVAQIRKSRRESGICTYCKEPSMAGFRYCKSHNKAEQRRRKKRLEDDALTIRSYTKAFLNRRASAGVCLRCESNELATKRYCAICTKIKSIASRKQKARMRKRAIDGYGGRCACCNESTLQFLVIDHKHNDGAFERRVYGLIGDKIYAYIVRNNFPDKYQVLCYNCNNARAHYGRCPHQDIIK